MLPVQFQVSFNVAFNVVFNSVYTLGGKCVQLPCKCNQQEDPQQKEYSMHLVGGAHHASLIAKYTDTLGPYGFGLVLRYSASQALYDEATSQYKAIKLYEGFLHDLLFEPERDDIVYDIINWMEIKLTTSPPMTRRV